jgi:hypothetical protein
MLHFQAPRHTGAFVLHGELLSDCYKWFMREVVSGHAEFAAAPLDKLGCQRFEWSAALAVGLFDCQCALRPQSVPGIGYWTAPHP